MKKLPSMLDNHFDNFFKAKLSEEQAFLNPEQEWKNMARQLDATLPDDHKRHRGLYMIAALLLLVSGGLGFALYKLNKVDVEMAQLRRAINKVQNRSAAAQLQPATFAPAFSTTPQLVAPALVTSTMSPPETGVAAALQTALRLFQTPEKEEEIPFDAPAPRHLLPSLPRDTANATHQPEKPIALNDNYLVDSNLVAEMPATDTLLAQHPTEVPAAEQSNTKLHQLAKILKPMSYGFGLQGGRGIAPRQDQIKGETDKLGGTYHFGMRGIVMFTRNFQVISDLQYLNQSLDYYDIEKANLPFLAPPPAGTYLEKVAFSQAMFQGSVGFKFIFNPDSKMDVYAGASLPVQWQRYQRFDYVFRDQLTEELSKESIYTNTHDLIWNTINIKSGVEYNINENFSLYLEGNYNILMPEKHYYTPDAFGLSVGVACNLAKMPS